jgi:hypothetical protein
MADPQSVTLQFSPDGEGGDFAGDLSAVAQIGADLWIGTDEGTSVARLSPRDSDVYAGHTAFPLERCLELPGGDDEGAGGPLSALRTS